MLSTAHNATLLGLHEVLLGQPTGSVLRRAVVDLALGANRHLRATHHCIIAVLASRVHFAYIYSVENILLQTKYHQLNNFKYTIVCQILRTRIQV